MVTLKMFFFSNRHILDVAFVCLLIRAQNDSVTEVKLWTVSSVWSLLSHVWWMIKKKLLLFFIPFPHLYTRLSLKLKKTKKNISIWFCLCCFSYQKIEELSKIPYNVWFQLELYILSLKHKRGWGKYEINFLPVVPILVKSCASVCVYHVSSNWFGKTVKEMNAGGRSCFMCAFQHVLFTRFHPRCGSPLCTKGIS